MRDLQFTYTPEHANYHISIHDLATNEILVGDVIGAYFKFDKINNDLYL